MIEWDFIKFEKGEFCIDGFGLETNVEFHIWEDGEVIFKDKEFETKDDISVSFPELKEIVRLSEMLIEKQNIFLK